MRSERSPEKAPNALPTVPKAEQQHIVDRCATGRSYRSNSCIHEIFEEQVERTPEAVAVVYEGTQMSYAELNARANRLAHNLRGLGVGPESRVALCLDRSLEMVVGLLGVLKAGGAYVPLDPAASVESLSYMLADSGPIAVLTDGSVSAAVRDLLNTLTVPVIDFQFDAALWEGASIKNLAYDDLTPSHLAHIFYSTTARAWPDNIQPYHPTPRTHLYILDAGLQPVPIGIAGEIYIGGMSVARGFLHRPELTAERFVPDPYGDTPGSRMYKTGDLALYLSDGNIELLGRADSQVNIRGFGIELGEIEARLIQHRAIREVVVLAREGVSGDKRLVAYYTPVDGADISVDALRAYLLETIPEYMLPSAYVCLESMPLTPNGKLDRKALPAPDGDAHGVDAHEEPVGAVERALAQIWSDVLEVERVGRHDNFFSLGGDSVHAIAIQSAAERRHGMLVPVLFIFEYPTIRELAPHVTFEGGARA